MENHIFAWADLAADLVVAAAIIAVLFCFSGASQYYRSAQGDQADGPENS
jgi:hypothetical protein